MAVSYTPLNLYGSKATFTGRTQVLSELVGRINAGQSIALFGERQIGKTLLLWMLRDIVNGQVNTSSLIDQELKSRLPQLMPPGHNLQAVFIDLLRGGSTEASLLDYFLNELQEIGISFAGPPAGKGGKRAARRPASMNALFRLLSATLGTNRSLLILMDEMEELKRREGLNILIGVFRSASSSYKNLKFVFTGSYMWQETLTQGQQLWTHLHPFYLRRIDERQAREYLVNPLAAHLGMPALPDDLADHIISWSGCKPLLLQQICSIISTLRPEELRPLKDLEKRLLGTTQIEVYIRHNILAEVQLRGEQQQILRFLCRRPSSPKRIARRLGQDFHAVKMYLEAFDQDHFDTIQKQSHGLQARLPAWLRERLRIPPDYRVNGKLIELYGRENYRDEAVSRLGMFRGMARWALMLIFIVSAVALYTYVNPRMVTHRARFSNGDIIFNFPSSVEEAEEKPVVVYVKTPSGAPSVESLKINFSGDDIKYDNGGSSLLTFANLEPGVEQQRSIKYRVISGDHGVMKSRLSVVGEPQVYEFETSLRNVAVTKYGNILSLIITAIGLMFPGVSGWLALYKSLIPGKVSAKDGGASGGSGEGGA